jgi:hypothetical protein
MLGFAPISDLPISGLPVVAAVVSVTGSGWAPTVNQLPRRFPIRARVHKISTASIRSAEAIGVPTVSMVVGAESIAPQAMVAQCAVVRRGLSRHAQQMADEEFFLMSA